MQTMQNGIEVPTSSDDYALTEDLALMAATSNVIIRVASASARDSIPEKISSLTVYRTDIGRMEIYNGARWAVPATTERGYDYTTPSTIADVAYATVASVTFTSLGGKLKLAYAGVMENANSGQNRTADVQFKIDNTTDFGGITYNAPLVSGVSSPPFSVGMTRELTIGAGTHTIALQTRASAAGSVRNVAFSLTVSENP